MSGDLEAWARPKLTKALAADGSGPVETIFKLATSWLSWQQQIEVARGLILGDTEMRTYLTGLDVPRFTTLSLATTGSEPFPVETRPLGVPSPDEVPALALSSGVVDDSDVALTNPDAETGDDSGWTQVTPDLAVFTNGDAGAAGATAYSGTRFFYGGTGSSGEYEQSVSLSSSGLAIAQQVTLGWQQAAGAAGSKARMGLRFFDDLGTLIDEVLADMVTVAPTNTWQARTCTAVVPADTATVRFVIEFENVGGGTTDAYIDGITVQTALPDFSDDASSLSGWTVSPTNGGSTTGREVTIDSVGGAHGDTFKMTADEMHAYIVRDFAFDAAAGFELRWDQWVNDSRCRPSVTIGASAGAGMGLAFGSDGVNVITAIGLEDEYSKGDSLGTDSAPDEQWCTVKVIGTYAGGSTFDCVVTVTNNDTGATLVDGAECTLTVTGTQLVLKHYSNRDSGGEATRFDNVFLRLTLREQSVDEVTTFTAYVWRYVNEFGEASAPSLPSRTIQRTEGVQVDVTTPTDLPTGADGYGITLKQIYRLATGTQGTVYRFVAEIPLSQATYTDTLTDDELGEVLNSDDWDLPPDDLRFIIALPNGIMAGASGNQLCLSVQFRAHAWPVAYRLPTDSEITGLANVDNTVIIGTRTFVYVATGNSPDAYSMSKPGAPHACLSHRSFAYLLGFGAVFAGPDGLMMVNGPTTVRNLTASIFTREQWQALAPESIHGYAHDDCYTFFWDNGSAAGGYVLDMKGDGAGLVALGMHATAGFVDPEADALFLVLDAYDEPTVSVLADPDPLAGTQDGMTIYEHNAGDDLMRYRWRGKQWMLPVSHAFQFWRTRAAEFVDVALLVYTDDGLLMVTQVDTDAPDRLPVAADYDELTVEVVGTSRVRSLLIFDDMSEAE